MNKFFSFISVLFLIYSTQISAATDGQSCETAFQIALNSNNSYLFEEEQEEMYFQFTASSNDEMFAVIDENDLLIEVMSTISLYKMSGCEELLFVKSVSLEEGDATDLLLFDDLTAETDYLVKVTKDTDAFPESTSFGIQFSTIITTVPCPASSTYCGELLSNGHFSYVNTPNIISFFAFGAQWPSVSQVCNWHDVPYSGTCDLYDDATGTYAGIKSEKLSGSNKISEAMTNVLLRPTVSGEQLDFSIRLKEGTSSLLSIHDLPESIKVVLTTDATLNNITAPVKENIYDLLTSSTAQVVTSISGSQVGTTFTDFTVNNFTVNGAYDRLVIFCESNTDNPNNYYVLLDDVTLIESNFGAVIPHNSNATWFKSNISAGNSTVQNQKYIIEGEFIINENLTFQDCDLIMAEDARITVNNGATLAIHDVNGVLTEVKPCRLEHLWDGIFVDGASNSKLQIDGDAGSGNRFLKFSQMRHGIVVTDLSNNIVNANPTSFIRNAIFDRNLISIDIDNSGVTSGRVGFKIDNSEFTCSRPVLDNGTESYPQHSIKIKNVKDFNTTGAAQQGVILNNRGNALNASSQYSRISGAAGGILVEDSDFGVANTTFEQFNNYGAIPGSSLTKSNHALELHHPNNPSSPYYVDIGANQFLSCKHPIDAVGQSVMSIRTNFINYDGTSTTYNWYHGSTFAYLQSNSERVEIRDNRVYNVTQGILTEGLTDLLIGENIFDLQVQSGTAYLNKSNSDGFAMIVRNVNTNVYTNCFIRNNTIKHAKLGIQAWFTNAHIEGNTITDMNDLFIQQTNCAPFGACPPPADAFGIRVLNAERFFRVISNRVINNSANYTYSTPHTNTKVIGISLENSANVYNMASQVKCNKTEKTGIGLRFVGSNAAGTIVKRNRMEDNYRGFVLANNGFIGDVGSNQSALNNLWDGTFGWSKTFADHSNGDLCTLYVQSTSYYNPTILSTHATANYFPIRKSTGHASQLGVDCNLMSRTKPGQNGNNTNGLALGRFRAQNMAKGKMDYMVKAADSAVRLNQQLLYWQLAKDSLVANDSIWKPFADSMKLTAMGKTVGKNRNGYSTANNADLNLNEVNAIQAKIDQAQALSAQEWQDLERIAMLCPYYDGLAVYLARNILLDRGYPMIMNACETAEQSNKTLKRIKTETNKEIRVYPNPMHTLLNLEYSVKEEDQIQLVVYNVLGEEQISRQLLQGEQHQLNVAEWIPGIYLYRLVQQGKVMATGKLIKQ